jgi:hypothetical protein
MLRDVSLDPSGISSKSLTASRPVLALDLEVGRPCNRKKAKAGCFTLLNPNESRISQGRELAQMEARCDRELQPRATEDSWEPSPAKGANS